jgi:hypothetical protein
MSSSTEVATGYRNVISIGEGSGWQQIARANESRDWKFQVEYTAHGSTTDRGTIQIGPTETPLTGGVQTVWGVGGIAPIFSWVRAEGDSMNFRANPFDKKTVDPWPVRTVASNRNTYLFQLDAGPSNETKWSLDISIGFGAGSSAKQMQLLSNNGVLAPLKDGTNTFSALISDVIYVSIEELKGTMKIGYTLTETGAE